MELIIAGLEILIVVGFIGFWLYFFIFENKSLINEKDILNMGDPFHYRI